ncbi:hypothetical protein BCR42DRAFT_450144 [Absidia repens]|uniref:Uncharacterized protein n=1 Tax=Absidia repens TaxID=90262 RepID=A0A1X2IP06_9FUNG|nr:hypothetical protein BCR42DRAFT_450144 [Absidia repens]
MFRVAPLILGLSQLKIKGVLCLLKGGFTHRKCKVKSKGKNNYRPSSSLWYQENLCLLQPLLKQARNKQDQARPSKTKQDQARPSKTKQDQARPSKKQARPSKKQARPSKKQARPNKT